MNRFKYGSHMRASTLLMSARMPRSVGNHDSMTYTKMIMLYASESDTIRYFKLSMRGVSLLANAPGAKPRVGFDIYGYKMP